MKSNVFIYALRNITKMQYLFCWKIYMHTLDLMEEEHYHACHMNFTSTFVFGMSLLENLFLLLHTISEGPGVTQTVV